MNANLVVVPAQDTEILAGILDGINQLEDEKRRLIALLPKLQDEEVTQTRMGARVLGVWAWVIECACDAEVLRRVEAKRGRGNKDVEEKGRVAAVNKHAYQCGQTPGTIYRNAQIYNRFQNVLIDQSILEEKGFYDAALRAPNPDEAIEVFAKEKDDCPFFSVKDAHRKAEKMKRDSEPKPEPPQKPGPELQKIHDDAVRGELEERLAVVRGWTEPVDPLLSRIYQRIEEMLEWQRTRDLVKDCAAIMLPVNKYGAVAEDDLPVWLDEHGFFMSDSDLKDRLEYMRGDDVRMLSKTDAGRDGKQEDRRGKLPQMYVKWFKDWKAHYKQYRAEEEDDAA